MRRVTVNRMRADLADDDTPPPGTAIVRPLRHVRAVRERQALRYADPADPAGRTHRPGVTTITGRRERKSAAILPALRCEAGHGMAPVGRMAQEWLTHLPSHRVLIVRLGR